MKHCHFAILIKHPALDCLSIRIEHVITRVDIVDDLMFELKMRSTLTETLELENWLML